MPIHQEWDRLSGIAGIVDKYYPYQDWHRSNQGGDQRSLPNSIAIALDVIGFQVG